MPDDLDAAAARLRGWTGTPTCPAERDLPPQLRSDIASVLAALASTERAKGEDPDTLAWIERVIFVKVDNTCYAPEHPSIKEAARLIYHRLAALASPAKETEGWRDIASAPPPKDGTDFLVSWPASALMGVVRWDEGEGAWTEADDHVAGFTHWRPLPSPPTPDETQAKEGEAL
jgi:hypothetical protein